MATTTSKCDARHMRIGGVTLESECMRRELPPEVVVAGLRELADSQHGLATWSQLRALGLLPAAINRLVTKGLLQPVRRCVYRILGAASTRLQEIKGAQLWAGEGSLASHRTAAELHALPGGDPSITEILTLNNVRAPDLIVHRRINWLPGDAVSLNDIRVTSIERTIVDLASVVRPRVLGLALDASLLRPGITLGSISERLEATARQGRTGTVVLRALITERAGERAPVESPLERDLLSLIRRCGIPEPVAQHPVMVDGRIIARLDFAYPELKIGIELDGYAFHSSREAFENDRQRLNRLTNEGWHMLVFTHKQVKNRPSIVEAAVLAARRSRESSFSGS